jgi:O-glycosyl hydrolase
MKSTSASSCAPADYRVDASGAAKPSGSVPRSAISVSGARFSASLAAQSVTTFVGKP